MIEIDGKKITFTQGDRFDVVFSLCGYVLKPEDRVIFTVKKYGARGIFLKKEKTGLTGSGIRISISEKETRRFPLGPMLYDIAIDRDGCRRTILFPSVLYVVGCVGKEGCRMNGECMPHGPPNIRIAVPPSWGDMTGAVDEARRYAEEAQQAADGMDIATLQDIDRIFEGS